MSQRFSLTTHCHQFLSSRTHPSGVFVDMTVGKGKDLAFLLKLSGNNAHLLMAIDIQESALAQSRQYMSSVLSDEEQQKIQWRQGSHENVGDWLQEWPQASCGVSLALYNLGYLPGSDKQVTTQASSTIKSLNALMSWIVPGGGISLMIYPGHEQGQEESLELDRWLLESVDSEKWHLWQMRRLGHDHSRACRAPYWIWMQKIA